METDRIVKATKKLIRWIEDSDYKGYDPFDIWENKLALYSVRSGSKTLTEGKTTPVARILRGGFYYFDILFPEELRNLLSVKKRINAKGMGLFASSYLNLYQINSQKSYLDKSVRILQWLVNNGNENFGGIGWGYPFHWQSKKYLPRYTPSSVVTSIVGEAFLKYWRLTKEKWAYDIIERINEFFISGLNVDYVDENDLCFSYTPLDWSHVHNANLFVTDYLLRTYGITKNNKQLEMAQKSLNYTLKQQNSNGSFYYYGYPGKVMGKIDHFHTGFVILSLKHIWENNREKRVYQSLKKCFKHYLDELFLNGIPKFRPSTFYPVNIHSLTVAIITLANMKGWDSRVPYYLKSTIEYALNEFQDTTGYFYYRIEKIGPMKWKVKFPYIRWAEAWMLYALTEYFRVHKSECNIMDQRTGGLFENTNDS